MLGERTLIGEFVTANLAAVADLLASNSSSTAQRNREAADLLRRLADDLIGRLSPPATETLDPDPCQAALENHRGPTPECRDQRELRRTLNLMQAVFDNTSNGIFIKDRAGKYLLCNEAAGRISGRPAEEIVGLSDTDLIEPEDLEVVRDQDRVVMETGLAQTREYDLTTRGEVRSYVGTKSPYRDDAGNIIGVVGIVRDVTRQKQTEREIRTSEERLRELADAIPQIVWTANADGSIISLNRRAVEYTGVAQDQLAGWNWTRVVHPDDRSRVFREWIQIRESRAQTALKFRIRRHDGAYRWHICREMPIRDPVGKVLRWYGTGTDIHDQVAAEEALRQSESLLRSIIENAGGLIWVKDLQGRYTLVNRFIEPFFGYKPQEFIGKTVFDLFPQHDAEAYERNNQQVLETGETQTFEEIAVIDGKTRTFLSTKFPLRNEIGEITSLAAVCTDITPQKEMEQTVRESEARLRAFVENAGDAFGLHNRGGIIVDVNQQACDSLGYTREEIIGRPVTDFDVGIPQTLLLNITERLDRGETVTIESRHRRKDGSEFPTEVRVRPFWMNGERFSVSLARDISERKRIEAALQESEIRLRTLIDHASDGFFLRRRGGEILDVNQTACDSLGYTREELIGTNLHDYVIGLDEADVQDVVRRLDDGETVSIEARHKRKQGETFPVEIRIRPFWVNGERYSVSLVRDISERLLAEEELLSQQKFISRIAAASPHVFYVFDVQRKCGVYTNRQLASDLGFRGAELEQYQGDGFVGLMHPDDAKMLPILFARWENARDDDVLDAEYRLRDVHGKWHWFISRDTVFSRSSDGRVEQLIGTAQDVTERKALEEQLRQAQKMEAIGQLAGGVAHDFNNLLTVVNGYCELLLADHRGDSVSRERILAIRDAGRSAASLTHQLLAFGRRALVTPRLIDLNDLIAKLESLLRPLLGEEIRIHTILEPGLPLLKADPNQIEQVLLNLAVNARDAMTRGGTLSVQTESVVLDRLPAETLHALQPGPYVQMTISDTGLGIDEHVLPRIFEPFFTTKEAGKGTGLGLAVVHGIITQSGGWIDVDSRAGHGTAFRILFPAVPVEHSPPLAGTGESVRGSGSILLIEDEDAVRRIVKLALESHGYRVLEASGKLEVDQLIETGLDTIDLIVTDVVMPGKNGREIVDEIRRRYPGIPALFISGYTDDEVVKRGVFASTDAFLQKPFTPAVLTRKVHELLLQARTRK